MTRRRLLNLCFNLLSLLSLLLCLGVAGLWVRSYWRSDQLGWGTGNLSDASGNNRYFVSAKSDAGRLALDWTHAHAPWSMAGTHPPPGLFFRVDPDRPSAARLDVGFRDSSTPMGSGIHRVTGLVVPHWLVALFAGVPPLWWLAHWRSDRGKIVYSGLCPSCGYDLRATPERCPECGLVSRQAIPPLP